MTRFSTPRAWTRVGLTGLGLLLCSGCASSFIYATSRYGTVQAVQIHLGCHDTYEAFDRPDAGSVLVKTNGLNEALGLCGDGVEAQPRDERLRRAATIYLEETTNRPLCRIVSVTAVGTDAVEFAYQCPAPREGKAKPASRKPLK